MEKSIFRAYDIRGIYPTELNEDDAKIIVRHLIGMLKPKKAAVGRDARLAAPAIHRAVCESFLEGGVDLIDLGMIATDISVFAAGTLDIDLAVMVTASHNPKEWIGLKITLRGGESFGGGGEIEALANLMSESNDKILVPSDKKGKLEKKDVSDDWIKHLLTFVDPKQIKPLKVAVDAGNGVAGPIVKKLCRHLPQVELVELFFEPDGNFPNHLPSPIEPENKRTLQKKVVEEKADLGMVFDGDADRVFLVDEKGNLVTGSETTAMVMDEVLSEDPKRIVLYNAICGWNVRDVVKKHQAVAYRTKVGHGYIKKDMKKYGAYFAGEHSGHYFFQNNFNADSGLLAALFVLRLLSKFNGCLSQLLEPHRRYFQIPETNFKVGDPQKVMAKVAATYSGEAIDWLDGLTIRSSAWWANIRPSANEPLLRLNIEAISKELLDDKKRELTTLIQSEQLC